MKKLTKLMSLFLVFALTLSCIPAAFAAEVDDAVINPDAACSLTVFKFDWTNAVKDGVWNQDSFISTGWRESYVEETLGGAIRKGDANSSADHALGNGQTSNGYAIAGVEFTSLKVADIVAFTESANDGHEDYNLTQVLYGFDKTAAAALLTAIGLENGKDAYANAAATDKLDSTKYYYTSDTLNKALADALSSNSTTVKNALETYIKANGGSAMPLTNENGKTSASNLPVGLYLMVETKVPEMVTSTVNPFFVSLPMTTVSGNDHSASPEGGHQWNYDVTVYPKNETGIPTLEKLVRESKQSTGKNNGTDTITDGFSHTASGSAGDVMEYEILSTLPTITSKATALSVYNFYDTISAGLTYQKDSVKIEFFKNKECTDKAATWDLTSGKFTVTYSEDGRHMTIDITEAGLAEINGGADNSNGKLYAGYSNYTARVTYTAVINSDASFVFGENGNDNKVVLTWKRSSSDFYDTLIDDTHVFSFGIDLTKVFSDKDSETASQTGMFKHVKFKIYNETDKVWLTAKLNETEGVYYVTGHTAKEADASVFVPVTSGGKFGKIIVKGCEEDTYVLTEIETANGYTLLKNKIKVTISVKEDAAHACDIYSKDVVGVLQNDPHYSFDGGQDLHLANIPQKALAHNFVSVSASVDKNAVNMVEDNGSKNAEATLKVVNSKGFDLPETGDSGTMLFGMIGVLLMAASGLVILFVTKKSKKNYR